MTHAEFLREPHAVGFVASEVIGESAEVCRVMAPYCLGRPRLCRLHNPLLYLGTFYSLSDRAGIVNLLVTLIVLN